MSRCLVVIFLVTVTAAFGQDSRRDVQFPGPSAAAIAAEVSEPGTANPTIDEPQFTFEIRLVTAPERLVDKFFDLSEVMLMESPPVHPFEDWKPLDSRTPIDIRSFETRVKPAFELSHGPRLIELADAQVREFIEAAQGDSRSNILFAPKLTVFAEQVGAMQDESKVNFLFSDAKSGKKGRSTAVEGTRIFVRATRRENGDMDANARIELHALPNRHEIPLTDDGMLSRRPEQTVTTMDVAGILRGETLHMAMMPPEPLSEPEKPESFIQRASFRRKQPRGVTRMIVLVSLRCGSATE